MGGGAVEVFVVNCAAKWKLRRPLALDKPAGLLVVPSALSHLNYPAFANNGEAQKTYDLAMNIYADCFRDKIVEGFSECRKFNC